MPFVLFHTFIFTDETRILNIFCRVLASLFLCDCKAWSKLKIFYKNAEKKERGDWRQMNVSYRSNLKWSLGELKTLVFSTSQWKLRFTIKVSSCRVSHQGWTIFDKYGIVSIIPVEQLCRSFNTVAAIRSICFGKEEWNNQYMSHMQLRTCPRDGKWWHNIA